jgi:hypothetical protein
MHAPIGWFDVVVQFITAGVVAAGTVLSGITFTQIAPSAYNVPIPPKECTVCVLDYDNGCTMMGNNVIGYYMTVSPNSPHECENYCASVGAYYCKYNFFGQCEAYRDALGGAFSGCNAGNWGGYCYTTTSCANTTLNTAPETPVPAAPTDTSPGTGGSTPAGTGSRTTTTCTPRYSCSGNTIMYRSADCTDSALRTCTAPAICEEGSAACKLPSIGFGTFTGIYDYTDAQGVHTHTTLPLTGHLRAYPALVKKGQPAHLYWNVTNAAVCHISSPTFADLSSDKLFSTETGLLTPVIQGLAEFQLHCTALPGASPATIDETARVNILPNWQEQ